MGPPKLPQERSQQHSSVKNKQKWKHLSADRWTQKGHYLHRMDAAAWRNLDSIRHVREARHKGISVVWFHLLETSQACKTMETGRELLRIWGGHMVSMLCVHEDLNWSPTSLCKAGNGQEWWYGPAILAQGR